MNVQIETTTAKRRLVGACWPWAWRSLRCWPRWRQPSRHVRPRRCRTLRPGRTRIGWAQGQLGSTAYDGLRQGFVEDAYQQGAGLDIGSAASAIDYWNAHPELQHLADLNVPSGALVF